MNKYKFHAQYQHFVNLAMLYALRKTQPASQVRQLCEKVSELVGDSADIVLAVKEAGLNDDDVLPFSLCVDDPVAMRALEIEMNAVGIELAKHIIISHGGIVTRVQLTTPPIIHCTPVDVRPTLFGCTLAMKGAA